MPKRKWVRVGAGVFLASALLFAGLLLADQWEQFRRMRAEVGGFGWELGPGWLAAAVALATLDLFWMGAAWVRLYRAGGERLGTWRGVRVWLATNLGRYIPGKVWQLSGLAVHLRQTGGSGAMALSSALTFQVVTLLTGTAVGAAVLGGSLRLLPGGSLSTVLLLVLLLLVLLHPAVVGRATRLAGRLLGEERDPEAVPGGGHLLRAAADLLVAWALYGAAFWCFVRGLTGRAAPDPVLLTGVFAASYVAGYLVLVAPGGLVVREGAMTALLAALTALSAPVAAALAVLARVWVTVSEIVGFGAALAFRGDGEDRGRAT